MKHRTRMEQIDVVRQGVQKYEQTFILRDADFVIGIDKPYKTSTGKIYPIIAGGCRSAMRLAGIDDVWSVRRHHLTKLLFIKFI